MALLIVVANMFHRTYDVGRALFLAAAAMSFWNPMIVFNMSFQLSFLATFALVFVTPLVLNRYERLIEKLPQRFGIREIIVSSLVIELFLLPLILYAIGDTSVIAVISNVLILPMLPIAMLTGFVAVMMTIIYPLIALPAVAVAYLSLGYILFVAQILGTIPFALVTIPMPLWCMIVCYVLLAWWYIYLIKNKGEEGDDKITNAIERFSFINLKKE
jgi:competence protein ComEC